MLMKSFAISMLLIVGGCQSLGTDTERSSLTIALVKNLSCALLNRVKVTPSQLDRLTASTQYEIETNELYAKSLKCLGTRAE